MSQSYLSSLFVSNSNLTAILYFFDELSMNYYLIIEFSRSTMNTLIAKHGIRNIKSYKTVLHNWLIISEKIKYAKYVCVIILSRIFLIFINYKSTEKAEAFDYRMIQFSIYFDILSKRKDV